MTISRMMLKDVYKANEFEVQEIEFSDEFLNYVAKHLAKIMHTIRRE